MSLAWAAALPSRVSKWLAEADMGAKTSLGGEVEVEDWNTELAVFSKIVRRIRTIVPCMDMLDFELRY